MTSVYRGRRYSSIKQKEGDLTGRQIDSRARFCREHGLLLADTLRDEGINAFKGKTAPKIAEAALALLGK